MIDQRRKQNVVSALDQMGIICENNRITDKAGIERVRSRYGGPDILKVGVEVREATKGVVDYDFQVYGSSGALRFNPQGEGSEGWFQVAPPLGDTRCYRVVMQDDPKYGFASSDLHLAEGVLSLASTREGKDLYDPLTNVMLFPVESVDLMSQLHRLYEAGDRKGA